MTKHLDHIVRMEAVRLAQHEDMRNTPKEMRRAAKLFAFAKYSGDVAGITRAIRLAEPQLGVPAEALDADPWMLGCENGTMDLRILKDYLGEALRSALALCAISAVGFSLAIGKGNPLFLAALLGLLAYAFASLYRVTRIGIESLTQR